MDHAQYDCFGLSDGDDSLVKGDCDSRGNKHQSQPHFRFNAATELLEIDQSWFCDENSAKKPVSFVGTGERNLPLDCKLNKCSSGDPIRISARLLEPVKLSPFIPPPPAGHDTPGCISRSESPSWDISSFEWRTGGVNYTWQTFSATGIGVTGVGMVRLNITNRANKQEYSCVWETQNGETSNVTLSGPPYVIGPPEPSPAWYFCDTRSLNETKNTTHNYEIETSLRLVSAEKRLLVNQTWYCDDEGATSPIQFHALGAAELPSLECRDRPLVEADAASLPYAILNLPIINGSICTGSNFAINGDIESRYVMEPYALELPNPESPKCTVNSFDPDKQYFLLDTSFSFQPNWWYFESNTSYRDSEGKPSGGLEISLQDHVSDSDLDCMGWSSKLNPNGSNYDPDYWFDCSVYSSTPAVRNWKANYNANNNILSVGVTWGCEELSPGNPIVFTAFGQGKLGKPECHDEGDGTGHNVTRCKFPTDSNTLPIPFTNITWSMS
ncbi:hypothetical protein F5Y19DRAFT_449391 [Xylariaceae sp. FL1651]|nr:hypothetical protein F5Y19DRAFT_449391 [Xylariaceae sp. FL1651]